MTDGRCRFVPWIRTGFEPDREETPHAAPTDAAMPSAPVALDVRASGRDAARTHTTDQLRFSVYGPGEVRGIDHDEIMRTEPADLATDFPPNYFPLVEFASPDLPWAFSPRSATADGRLRPWICLVAVRKQDGVTVTEAETPRPGVLDVRPPATPAAELPDLVEAWAWAHAQVVGDEVSVRSPDSVRMELGARRSRKTVSRLVAPRRLLPGEAYYACVVPVYERGRLAGLGQEPSSGAVPGGALAWSVNDPPASIRLPVYYYWEFETGPAGDFESLARALTPQPLPESVGYRDLDVSDPGPAELETATPETLRVGGALRSVPKAGQTEPTYSEVNNMAALLNRSTVPGASDVPVVGPPMYGQWYAARSTIPPADETPVWYRELNTDPRHRVAAALGTRLAQDQQQHLLASAWAQFGDLQAANDLLRGAQLAREGNRRTYRFLDPGTDAVGTLDPATSLLLTEPLHGRVTVEAGPGGERATVARRVERSRIPRQALEPAFRRALRPRGPLARRFADQYEDWAAEQVVRGLDDGTVAVEQPDGGPGGVASLSPDELAERCERVAEITGEPVEPLDPETRARFDRLNAAADRAIGLRESIERRLAEGELDAVEILVDALRGTEARIGDLLDALEPAILARGRDRLEEQWHRLRDAHDEIQSILTGQVDPADLPERLARLAELQTEERYARRTLERLLGADVPERAELANLVDVIRGHRDVALRAIRTARTALDRDDWDRMQSETGPVVTLEGRCEEAGAAIGTLRDRLDEWDGATTEMVEAGEELGDLVGQAMATVADLREAVGRGDVDGARAALDDLSETCEAFDDTLEQLANMLGVGDRGLTALGSRFCRPSRRPAERPPLDIEAVAEAVVDAINPEETVLDYARDKVDAPAETWTRRDPLDEIVPTPEFPRPLSEPLADLSQDYLLPGLESVPQDSIGLLATNPAFVAAFHVGFNHEAIRELTYGGLAVSLRATPARQFWDVRGQVADPTPAQAEALKDVAPIHAWDPDAGLAANVRQSSPAEPAGPAEERLVLLVRGQLLHRYPTTRVFAVKGKWAEGPAPGNPAETTWRRVPLTESEIQAADDSVVRNPIFRGSLDPDVTFLGFGLDRDEARGNASTTGAGRTPETAGWFFVLEEPPAEARFGLDEDPGAAYGSQPGGWDDLTWRHVLADPDKGNYVPVRDPPDSGRGLQGTSLGGVRWGKNAAHMAAATWQRPVSVAIHADDMLLEDQQ